MVIGVLSIQLHLPGCNSLKEKRGRLKPILSRVHKEFNVSTAEMGMNDSWQESLICCAIISNDNGHIHRVLQQIVEFIPANWPDAQIIDHRIENV
jgi:uncharacterized protein YlxP (DUF503 family)